MKQLLHIFIRNGLNYQKFIGTVLHPTCFRQTRTLNEIQFVQCTLDHF